MSEITEFIHWCRECEEDSPHTQVFVSERTNTLQSKDGQSEQKTTYWQYLCKVCHTPRLVEISQQQPVGGDGSSSTQLIRMFPPSEAGWEVPEWAHQLNEPLLQELLVEVYTALGHELHRLAMMGSRTVVDVVCNSVVGDCGGFDQKLKKLVESGVVTESFRSQLHAAVDAGSAAAHRNHKPTVEDLERALNIIGTFVNLSLITPRQEAALRQTTPQRQRRTPGATT